MSLSREIAENRQGYRDSDGCCPKCGEAMEFECFEMQDGEEGFFECECPECHFEGRQWYKLEFDCLQELKEDGQYIDL